MASQSIDDCLTVLQQFRDDETFSEIFVRATAINEEEILMPRLTARQQHRSSMPASSSCKYYKRAVFLPFIDTCIAQLNERFRKHASKACQLSALLPSVCKTRTFTDIKTAAGLYRHLLPDGNVDALHTQYLRWKAYWNRQSAKAKRPDRVIDALCVAFDLGTYPAVAVMLQIFATIPVTTATGERSLSLYT